MKPEQPSAAVAIWAITADVVDLCTYHKLIKPRAPCIRDENAWIVGEGESSWAPMESSPLSLSAVHVETHLFVLHHQLTDRQHKPF